MSAAITFQVAFDVSSCLLQPGHLPAPEEVGRRRRARPGGWAVRPAVAAHVQHEDVQQRAVADRAIDRARVVGRSSRTGMYSRKARFARADSSGTLFSV